MFLHQLPDQYILLSGLNRASSLRVTGETGPLRLPPGENAPSTGMAGFSPASLTTTAF